MAIRQKFLCAAVSAVTSLVMTFSLSSAHAQVVPDWPDLYDPFTLLNLNVETVNPEDFDLIRNDTTYEIEVPAWFWAEDEEPILVSIRRKSASALPNELDPNKKVSFKIDINEYQDEDETGADICVDVQVPNGVCRSQWKAVKKLSLENGDDQDVVQEGFAWYLHRLAAQSGLNYHSGLAAWVDLTINGEYQGVYVNVEPRDKQFLKNRGLWAGSDDTWLYKMSDVDSPEIKEAPEDEFEIPFSSPASTQYCYKPFVVSGACPTPDDFKAQLEAGINMEGMLTFGAVSAFHYSPDDLFAKGKNFYYLDYAAGLAPREYIQWDLDSAFGSLDPNRSMYAQGRGRFNVYEKALVLETSSPFRAEYDAIVSALVQGPEAVFDPESLLVDLQDFEFMLNVSLAADPNSKNAISSFDSLAQYVPLRVASMQDQLPEGPPPPPSTADIHVGNLDGFATGLSRNNWQATVKITAHDYTHLPLGGVLVSASWSGGVVGDESCVTEDDGHCLLVADITSKRVKKVNLTVNELRRNGNIYVAEQNHDGNSVTISKP